MVIFPDTCLIFNGYLSVIKVITISRTRNNALAMFAQFFSDAGNINIHGAPHYKVLVRPNFTQNLLSGINFPGLL